VENAHKWPGLTCTLHSLLKLPCRKRSGWIETVSILRNGWLKRDGFDIKRISLEFDMSLGKVDISIKITF